jgi:hypothetical protein
MLLSTFQDLVSLYLLSVATATGLQKCNDEDQATKVLRARRGIKVMLLQLTKIRADEQLRST